MERGVGGAAVAKVGATVFACALGIPLVLSPAAASAANDGPASVLDGAAELAVLGVVTPPRVTLTEGTLAATSTIPDELEAPRAATRTEAPASASSVQASAAAAPETFLASPTRRATAPPEPLVSEGRVVASWYGPGFYGNRTACGQTYTPEIQGVAHRTLPCGTLVAITSPAGNTVTVPVIDRGPYVAGRSLDLSNATRLALACSDLCHVHMRVLP